MTSHCFAAALSPLAHRRWEETSSRAVRFWSEAPHVLAQKGGPGLGELLRGFDPRLALARVAGRLRIRAMELSAWPVAELVARLAPEGFPASAGLPPGDHEQALRVALARTGVSLTDARVRLGLTRGHLMAVVVEIPLDVTENGELLQLAAETYVEVCLGDDLSDLWIVSIDVVRSPRQRSMLRMADPQRMETHPIEELGGLVRRAARAIGEQCPTSWIEQEPPLWTALEIGPPGEGPQGDREHASTCCPEALKAALEGLPFDSRRFSQHPEAFVWMAFSADRPRRASLRDQAELFITEAAQTAACCRLAGTGFGEQCDYVDLWVPSDPKILAELAQGLAERLALPITVGFYDSRLSDEQIVVGHQASSGEQPRSGDGHDRRLVHR